MRGQLATIAVLGTVLLTGCMTKEGGSATATPGTPGPAKPPTTAPDNSTTSGQGGGVPKVDSPLDVSEFVDKPCTGLTQAQLDRLGVGNGKQDTEATGEYCRWTNGRGGYVNLAFVVGQGGLGGVYRGNEVGQFGLFQELPDISGYPAVIASLWDGRKDGDCDVAVGVADDTTLSVGTTQSMDKVGHGDPCQVTVDVIKQVLETVKAGG
ncbi:hypothetical protein UO65_6378 [Actinokineospora spheciospongiae]|uniref:DUF3558 domain-containing protein n=1 Tax=Actinokineospora spheciospongiae TaxID=909613 RepID=W7IPL9_9PSEU|nr:DUF3558 domain-containing protein [Actinokineospora spheciospongiae]EWC58486.1 hypothetical protein UO65_6378 [Actinokineospora spheciospongiae]